MTYSTHSKLTRLLLAALYCGLLWSPAFICFGQEERPFANIEENLKGLEDAVQTEPNQTLQKGLSIVQQPSLTAIQRAKAYSIVAHASCLINLTEKTVGFAELGLQQPALPISLELQLQLSKACGLGQLEKGKEALALLATLIERINQLKADSALLHEATRFQALAFATNSQPRRGLIFLSEIYRSVPSTGARVIRADIAEAISYLQRLSGDAVTAEKYAREALADISQTKASVRLNDATFDLAAALRNQGKLDESNVWFEKAFEIASLVGSRANMAYAQYGMGQLAFKKKLYQKALEHYDLAEEYFLPQKDILIIGYIYNTRARIAFINNDIPQAIEFATQAYNIGKTKGHLSIQKGALRARAEYYTASGNLKKAYEDLLMAMLAAENQQELEKGVEMSDLKAVFELNRERQNNLSLEKDNAIQKSKTGQQKNRLLLIILISLSVAAGIYGIARRLKKNHVKDEALEKIAHTDVLTGIANRRRIMTILEHELLGVQRYGKNFSVSILDLDHFKQVNDRYGHAAGDDVLRTFSQCVQSQLRQGDVLARIGGEEFLLYLPTANRDNSIRILNKIRQHLSNTIIPTIDASHKITFSAGTTVISAEDHDIKQTLRRADAALYIAKTKGRDRVECG